LREPPRDSQKADEVRKKTAEGSTKPLPTKEKPKTEAEAKEQEELEAKTVKMAKAINTEREALKKKLEDLKKQLDDANKKEKDERDKLKNAKKAEADKSLAERSKKAKQIEDADLAVAKCQKDLELTDEWKDLEKAKKSRESIGPLPKIVRASRTGEGRKSNGLTGNMVKLLMVMKDGKIRGSAELAEATGILKGKPFPLMGEMGLIDISVEEGQRGRRFKITAKGKQELEKSLAEE
jgi:membrane protein involved in colicin uptake